MTAGLVVSAVCLGRWSGSWDRLGRYLEKMTTRKKTLINSMSFVVLLLGLWRWCWYQHWHENETRRN